MEKENSDLLPHILQTLSEKPQLCETYENLCNEIKFVLSAQNLQDFEIENDIESALNVGQNLGILTCTNDIVRMPFSYNKKTTRPIAAKKRMRKTVLHSEEDEMDEALPTRLNNRAPAIKEMTSKRRRRTVRRRSRVSRQSRKRVSRRRSSSRRRR